MVPIQSWSCSAWRKNFAAESWGAASSIGLSSGSTTPPTRWKCTGGLNSSRQAGASPQRLSSGLRERLPVECPDGRDFRSALLRLNGRLPWVYLRSLEVQQSPTAAIGIGNAELSGGVEKEISGSRVQLTRLSAWKLPAHRFAVLQKEIDTPRHGIS